MKTPAPKVTKPKTFARAILLTERIERLLSYFQASCQSSDAWVQGNVSWNRSIVNNTAPEIFAMQTCLVHMLNKSVDRPPQKNENYDNEFKIVMSHPALDKRHYNAIYMTMLESLKTNKDNNLFDLPMPSASTKSFHPYYIHD